MSNMIFIKLLLKEGDRGEELRVSLCTGKQL